MTTLSIFPNRFAQLKSICPQAVTINEDNTNSITIIDYDYINGFKTYETHTENSDTITIDSHPIPTRFSIHKGTSWTSAVVEQTSFGRITKEIKLPTDWWK